MSIRLRVIGAFLIIIAIVVGFELYDRYFIANISGDAMMINFSGTQRYRTAKLAYLSRTYIEKKDRDDLRILFDELDRYEKVLNGLIHGSKELGLKGAKREDILSTLHETESLWEKYKKQISFLAMTSEIPADAKIRALDEVDTMALPLLEKMDNVTFALDRESTASVEKYKKVKLYSLITFIIVSLFLTIEVIRAFIRPMTRLLDAIDRVGAGDLDLELKMERNDEFSRVAASFNHMTGNLKRSRKELEKVNKELEDFTYTVSHDLKEPLRSIASFSQFVLEDYKDKVDEEGKDYLNRIVKASSRMRLLIDDLLTLSRVGRVKNPFSDVPSSEILKDVTASLYRRIEEKKAEIKGQRELPVIYCDKVFMNQVFLNLLSNALKFCDKDHPVVEVGYTDLPGEYRFHVRDNGIGIDERYFEKIFEIFESLNRREDYEGTGAGLTIVKKVIEEHHGRVWVESKLGEGSTFYFTVPKKKTGEGKG